MTVTGGALYDRRAEGWRPSGRSLRLMSASTTQRDRMLVILAVSVGCEVQFVFVSSASGVSCQLER